MNIPVSQFVIILTTFLQLITCDEISPADEIMVKNGYNLNVTPKHYDLQMRVDDNNNVNHGMVHILLNVASSISEFMINSKDLEIRMCLVDGRHAPFAIDNENGRLNISLNYSLEPGIHDLHIWWNAPLNTNNESFYISYYCDGKKKFFSTSFEPEEAR
ncbi:aminopeptidase [Pseudoloma neurophilia]|uniref:Aminopeptidase n=1 Tax=Pseudoloma neurophilia TaxID=146866 RepID=A0A0R0LV29_9MICR|nr:aminopeptidase [Pseudoloma neurophilia]